MDRTILVVLSLLLVVTVVSATLGIVAGLSLPFVMVTGVSPDSPEVFDVVAFTVHVESGGSVPVKEINWLILETAGMVVKWNASAPLNITGPMEFVVYYPFQHPGDYYLRASISDLANRTAEDVYRFTVRTQVSVLAFNVYPDHVNASNYEPFWLNLTLTNTRGVGIADAEVQFYYANANSTERQWLAIAAAYTDGGGHICIIFTPQFEGVYAFKTVYLGDSLHDAAEAEYGINMVAPEFPFTGIVLVSAMFLVFLSRKITDRLETWRMLRMCVTIVHQKVLP